MKRKGTGKVVSEALRAARDRNHMILRLRGAAQLFRSLGNRAGIIAVNMELAKLNAARETD